MWDSSFLWRKRGREGVALLSLGSLGLPCVQLFPLATADSLGEHMGKANLIITSVKLMQGEKQTLCPFQVF